MIVLVGSKNPVKLTSVYKGLKEYHPDDNFFVVAYSTKQVDGKAVLDAQIRVILQNHADQPATHYIVGIEVESGVSAQPFSAEETLQGGRNRANALRQIITNTEEYVAGGATLDGSILPNIFDFSFVVGIEGGIERVDDKWLESGYIVVQSKAGLECVGTSARFELANHVIADLKTGKELCEVADRLSQSDDVRSNSGYMGLITRDLLMRDRAYNHGVLFAFARFFSPPQYWD
jgi:non-canonical (house-cleaning) NTP pyrophosphatase